MSDVLSRRDFCRSVAVGGLGVCLEGGLAEGAKKKKGKRVRFYKNLGCGHIGVRANHVQALDYAVEYGFDGITPSLGEFEKKSDSEIAAWVGTMKAKKIRYGCAGLPVQYRKSEEEFRGGMAKLAKQAEVLKKLGVKRMATWLTPGHGELTYEQNFKLHSTRLREVCKVLNDYGIRLGLEFVGPKTSRTRSKYEFIYNQKQIVELMADIGTGNVGILMDSWHWYTSGGTLAELTSLKARDIVHVHVNDAPAGIAVDKQMDMTRKLPVTTGVIDMTGFINGLVKIGYNGPVECEPFDKELRAMDDPAAVKKTAAALERVWELIKV